MRRMSEGFPCRITKAHLRFGLTSASRSVCAAELNTRTYVEDPKRACMDLYEEYLAFSLETRRSTVIQQVTQGIYVSLVIGIITVIRQRKK